MEIEVASSFHRGGGGESSGGGGGGGEKVVWNGGAQRGTYLVWEDLTVVLPNFGKNKPTRRLLQGLTGYAEPGRIMAIMGPSGSGKSTLLDSLAGLLLSLSLTSLCSFLSIPLYSKHILRDTI